MHESTFSSLISQFGIFVAIVTCFVIIIISISSYCIIIKQKRSYIGLIWFIVILDGIPSFFIIFVAFTVIPEDMTFIDYFWGFCNILRFILMEWVFVVTFKYYVCESIINYLYQNMFFFYILLHHTYTQQEFLENLEKSKSNVST